MFSSSNNTYLLFVFIACEANLFSSYKETSLNKLVCFRNLLLFSLSEILIPCCLHLTKGVLCSPKEKPLLAKSSIYIVLFSKLYIAKALSRTPKVVTSQHGAKRMRFSCR